MRSPIKDRIRALDELHRAGIRTYAMIAPMLPGAEDLAEILAGKVDYVILDRMNYHYADWVYRKYGLEDKMTDEYFSRTRRTLSAQFTELGNQYPSENSGGVRILSRGTIYRAPTQNAVLL